MNAWTDSAEQLAILLNLTQVSGIGAARLRNLISRFQSPAGVASATIKDLVGVDGIDEARAVEIQKAAEQPFGRIQIEKLFENSYRLVTFWSQNYPTLLKHIDDPPILLFVWGDYLPVDAFSIAVVGTRGPTRYGRLVTEKLVSGLVAAGATIISGLARGVDTIAHAETVKRGGRTVAVLGSGLDMIYPAENRSLAQAIAENGAIVTELPFGTKPDAMNFPRRNRIISGLTLGTLVVEAGAKSGALITARLALDQNREVFAVPGSIFSPQSVGCHALIQEGAKLVNTVDDILEELPKQGELFAQQEFAANQPADLSETQRNILRAVGKDPVHIDQLTRQMNMDTGELLTYLLQLEFQGLIRQLPGKLFVRG